MKRIRVSHGSTRIEVDSQAETVLVEGKDAFSKINVSTGPSKNSLAKSAWISYLQIFLTIIAALSSLAMIVVAIWQWRDGSNLPPIISASMKVFSFALIGSLLSLGGINIFSLKSEIKSVSQSNQNIEKCPYIDIGNFDEEDLHRPGNPRFCMRCPLAIDLSSAVQGGLIHKCVVYPALHAQWKDLSKT